MHETGWTVTKDFRFEAAHVLPYHDGKCARLHGHSFKMSVAVNRDSLVQSGPKQSMAIDFGSIKKVVQPIVEDQLDHYFLNESTGLESPTSEALAQWVWLRIAPDLPGLHSITIHETCTSRVVYYGPKKDLTK